MRVSFYNAMRNFPSIVMRIWRLKDFSSALQCRRSLENDSPGQTANPQTALRHAGYSRAGHDVSRTVEPHSLAGAGHRAPIKCRAWRLPGC